jgi:plastocyanin
MQKLKVAALLALGVCFTWGVDLHAATTNIVKIRAIGTRFVFDPTNIALFTGDSIKWTNSDVNLHDTRHTSATPLWASPQMSNSPPNNTFSFTFVNTGLYPYRCQTHLVTHPEQTGTVSVVTPPVISFQTPTALPDGTVQLDIFGGSAGQRCIIDASDTLLNWSPIWTTNFPNTTCPACPFIEFIDTAKVPNRRYYRTRVFAN